MPDQPVTVCFPDTTQIPVLRAKDTREQETLLGLLVQRCSAATFGHGRKTLRDRTVRDALQIKAEGGAFSVLHFDPASADILEQIRRELTPQDSVPLTAELYNLNVYASGGHFLPHKDTPRGSDMLGTLVVCLPSQFLDGALVLKHHGVFQTFDWCQQRPFSRQTVSGLKGRDHQVAAATMAEGLEVTLFPYMVENCADETWQLDHFPTTGERAALGDRMGPWDLKSTLAVRASSEDPGDFDVIWVGPPPRSNAGPTMYPGILEGSAQAADPDLPGVTHLHSCEYSATGYFGNEGSELDFYVYGALHIAIPPFGEGPRAKAGHSRKRH